MPGQMSLFPSEEFKENKKSTSETEINALDEMFEASHHYRNSRNFQNLLDFISRFPKYSAFNCFLLYTQHPDATYVATAGNWVKRFSRKPRRDARPIIILAPMSPVRFLYDWKDTEGETFPANFLQPFDNKDRIPSEIYEKTIHNGSLHGIVVRNVPVFEKETAPIISLTYDIRRRFRGLNLDSLAKYLILVEENRSREDKFSAIVHGLGHLFCGHIGIDNQAWWPDRRSLDQVQAEVEAASVAYLVCRRKGLFAASERFISEFVDTEREIPAFGLNAVFHAVQYIEDMGKSLWKQPKKKSRYSVDSI